MPVLPHAVGMRAAALALLLAMLCSLLLGPLEAYAREPLSAETEQLIVEAVEAAYELDLFNNRCRQDRSGRRTENLNKLLASSFRMTVLDAQDDLFPEGYYRDARSRMSEDFLARLQALGGCAGAKEKKLRDTLRERYEQAMRQLEQFP